MLVVLLCHVLKGVFLFPSGRLPRLAVGGFIRGTEGRAQPGAQRRGGAGPRPETQTGEDLQPRFQFWVKASPSVFSQL